MLGDQISDRLRHGPAILETVRLDRITAGIRRSNQSERPQTIIRDERCDPIDTEVRIDRHPVTTPPGTCGIVLGGNPDVPPFVIENDLQPHFLRTGAQGVENLDTCGTKALEAGRLNLADTDMT